MRNPFLIPFVFLIFPGMVLYSIYMGLNRYSNYDYDAAIAYVISAILFIIAIYLSVRKKKKKKL